MNVENLRNTHPQLVESMSTVGFSKNYIQVVKQEIGFILATSEKWTSYDEILDYYEQQTINRKVFTKKKTVLNLIASFDCNGILPGKGEKATYFHKLSSYDYLNSEYRHLLDHYYSSVDRKSKKDTTIRNECWNTASFLLSLQKVGCSSLDKVTEDDILATFTDETGYPTKSASYAGQITAVFKYAAEWNTECQRILQYIPAIRKLKKNIQCLTPDERANIKDALRSTGNSLSHRDRAIGHLLYYTGLRCCDISNLMFSSIDLDKDEITISQQKTDVPLKLSLSAIVGNAIYDYVTEERRKSNSQYIFLSENPPYGKLKAGSIGVIANQIYDNAEIRQNPNDRRGGHLFRHNFATVMLENGVAKVVISKAMGQTSPNSTESYLSADMVHLKECALSIGAFHVRKEVFCCE
jgi:site-specific recombinase XerD